MASRSVFILMVILTLLLLLTASVVFSAEEKKPQSGPIVITANSLTADNKEKTALFEGSVIAKRGEMHLYADRMKIYYREEGSGSSINKIEAEGSVRLVRNKSIITSQLAVYLSEPEEKITFTGDPRASDGANIVTGSKMVYFIKEDRSLVENSKVFVVNKEGSSQVLK